MNASNYFGTCELLLLLTDCSAILIHERIMSGSFCISREYVSIDNVSNNINCINFLLKSLVTNYQDYLRLKR